VTKIAFVCIGNAGRSQMAAAFARRLAPRGIAILSGGTRPEAEVNPVVVQAMKERGIDISRERPRAITPRELEDADYVITMGCSAEDICPAAFRGDARDWGLPDPKGKSLEEVRGIRDEIEGRVRALLEEVRRVKLKPPSRLRGP
jgi:arsenate reductase